MKAGGGVVAVCIEVSRATDLPAGVCVFNNLIERDKHDKRTHHRGCYPSKANREVMPLHDLMTVSRTSTLQRSYPYVLLKI